MVREKLAVHLCYRSERSTGALGWHPSVGAAPCQREPGWASSTAPCVLQGCRARQACPTEQRGRSASAEPAQPARVPSGALPRGWAPFRMRCLSLLWDRGSGDGPQLHQTWPGCTGLGRGARIWVHQPALPRGAHSSCACPGRMQVARVL